MLLQADKRIRDIATRRNDSAIIAITSDELIAKEAHYHFPCYREYTREPSCPITTAFDEDTEEPESDMTKVVDFLNELIEKPDIIPLTTIQDLVRSESLKKNLKRSIQSKSENFSFIKYKNTHLVYPKSMKQEDIILKLFEAKEIINVSKQLSDREIVLQSSRIIREEIKAIKSKMSWPPTPNDLDMWNFSNPTNLDLFLTMILNGKEDKEPTDRVARLKSSFGQDICYAGTYLKNNGYAPFLKHISFSA